MKEDERSKKKEKGRRANDGEEKRASFVIPDVQHLYMLFFDAVTYQHDCSLFRLLTSL